MAKIITAFVAMAGFAMAFGMGGFTPEPKTDEELREWVVKEVAKSKKVIPQDCGNGVTWRDIQGNDKSVNYIYQIDRPAADIRAARSQIESAIGGSAMLKWMLPDGVTAYCSFYDQSGAFVFRMTMDD